MTSVDSTDFDARCERCSVATQELVAFLRTVAANAGDQVGPPTFEARGIGVTYWVNGRRFCRFDPKEDAGHVWAFVPGGDRTALRAAGTVSARDDGPWLTVTSMVGAVRLVAEILRAYDRFRDSDPDEV